MNEWIRKKGFTLLELLGIIIIIAVIALITTPIILNVIENSKKQAFLDSAYGILESANFSYFQANESGKEFPIHYKFENGKLHNAEIPLKFKGSHPQKGDIFLYKNGEIQLALWNGKYCVEKKREESEIKFTDEKESVCGIMPVIFPENGKTEYVELGDEYELNYHATSIEGEDITENVSVTIKQGENVVDEINTKLLGSYKVIYFVEDGMTSATNEVTVIVRDTKAPEITLFDTKENQSTSIEAAKAYSVPLAQVTDNSLYEGTPYHVTCGADNIVTKNGDSCIGISEVNPKLPGEYEVKYKAVDESGNESTLTYTVTVTPDVTAPEIIFTNNIVLSTSQTSFDQKSGVILVDNVSDAENIKLVITGTVSYGTAGSYKLIYKATDEAGNSSTKERTITIISSTVNFGYNGGVQNYTIPADGYYEISAWGAQGGSGGKGYNNNGGTGGYGGYIKVKTYLPKGEVISFIVGGMGGNGSAIDLVHNTVGGSGGYNGGSSGGGGRQTGEAGSQRGAGGGGGGGGATTIKLSDGSLIVQANGGSGGGGGADKDDALGGCGGAGGGGTGGVCASDYSGWNGNPGSYSKAGTTKYGNVIKIESTNGAKSSNGAASINFVGANLEETTYVFDYSASSQSFIAPEAGTYELSVWGAQGGKGGKGYNNDGGTGGLGGYIQTKVYLAKSTSLVITVGGMGGTGGAIDLIHNTVGGSGGYNGGSSGGGGRQTGEAGSQRGAGGGGGGGGATNIKLADGTVILQGNGGSGGGGGADYDDALGGCGGAGGGGTGGVCADSYSGWNGNPGGFVYTKTISSGTVTLVTSQSGVRSGHGLAIIKYVG